MMDVILVVFTLNSAKVDGRLAFLSPAEHVDNAR